MKKLLSPANLPVLSLAAGLLGALARTGLYLLGVDDSGLLAQYHPLQIFCWVLSAAVAVYLFTAVNKLEASSDYAANFPRNKRALPGAVLAAAGIGITVLTNWNLSDKLSIAWSALGLLSAAALIGIGLCRNSGKMPPFYLYGGLCLYYAVHIICRYKLWSANPQVADYCFTLLACAALILSAYQRTAFCAGMGNRKAHLLLCLLAGFFCILCAPQAEQPWLYLTSGYFFLSDLAMTLPAAQENEAQA